MIFSPECFSKIRRNQQCAIDSLQSSLDSETRSRIEVTRLKKNVEGDLSEMELQLNSANRQVSEATKSLGQLQTQVKVFQIVICGQGINKRQIVWSNKSKGNRSNPSREQERTYI